jgi:hypothetical protein
MEFIEYCELIEAAEDFWKSTNPHSLKTKQVKAVEQPRSLAQYQEPFCRNYRGSYGYRGNRPRNWRGFRQGYDRVSNTVPDRQQWNQQQRSTNFLPHLNYKNPQKFEKKVPEKAAPHVLAREQVNAMSSFIKGIVKDQLDDFEKKRKTISEPSLDALMNIELDKKVEEQLALDIDAFNAASLSNDEDVEDDFADAMDETTNLDDDDDE